MHLSVCLDEASHARPCLAHHRLEAHKDSHTRGPTRERNLRNALEPHGSSWNSSVSAPRTRVRPTKERSFRDRENHTVVHWTRPDERKNHTVMHRHGHFGAELLPMRANWSLETCPHKLRFLFSFVTVGKDWCVPPTYKRTFDNKERVLGKRGTWDLSRGTHRSSSRDKQLQIGKRQPTQEPTQRPTRRRVSVL